ncbi:MAG: Uncharacterised protein [Cryomorphaceae bacterium]|nr:MAG: Uncharacterised protein [Cryomorphaceae bacterium]
MFDGLQRSNLSIELIGLILSKITHLNIVSQFQNAIRRYLLHQGLHKRRFPLTVLSDKSHPISAFNLYIDTFQHQFLSVALMHTLRFSDDFTASRGRLELEIHAPVIFLIYLDALHAVELFDQTLRERSLTRLGFKALDQLLSLLNLSLLVLRGSDLLLTNLCTQLHITAVRRIKIIGFTHRDFNRPIRDIIQKRSIVTDHHKRLTTRA